MTTKIIKQKDVDYENRDIHIRIYDERIIMQQGRDVIEINRENYDELAEILKDELILKLPIKDEN